MKKNTRFLSFAEKVRKKKKTIMYELLPPPKHLSKIDIERSLSLFVAMINNYPVDAINIPEVREEVRSGNRATTELIKLEPRAVCKYLQKFDLHNLIVNRPIVHIPWKKQKLWLEETYHLHNIRNFIFVGGESSTVTYPGFSVVEASKKISQDYHSEFPNICLGGITIPTRNEEAKRVFKKAQSGIEFFTTQIVYEVDSVKKFLKEYSDLCLEKNSAPKMIFLSFAPVATNRDVELLQWLGVEIPQQTLEILTTGWLGMGWRSLQICQDLLEDILQFVEDNDIHIPLGLNIEHVNRHNFESSFILLERLSEIYRDMREIGENYKLYD